ncbi:DUF7666 domain-containing protein [Paraconexibacter algicola]|uniref:DUF7666 domain-containing protein n=1 Tax=Paraconexibacter algicola TaxID=2133960 RepID=UPI0011B24A89|nr:hypothetical protein [Paraconexibacter algicola]
MHKHGARPSITGGVVIHVPEIRDGSELSAWCDYYGVDVQDGQALVYKAVDDDLRSGRGCEYPIGETVECADWHARPECGQGLHFSPRPFLAIGYFTDATRFLRCAIPVAETVVLGDKVKASRCTVVCEVDIDGNPLSTDERGSA